MTPEQEAELLSQGAEEILPEGEFAERLRRCRREGTPLRVKQGFDPTAPDIHLGHTVGLRKLRQFQDLGHQVVLIVGDYTGLVGDPSGLAKTRPQLSEAQVEVNARTYLDQFYRVMERDPRPPRRAVEVLRNSQWLSRMRFLDVIGLASRYTVARMLERDDFAQRLAARQPIGLHELFYPLMQGYDSIAVRADVELGGTDQKFNLLVGRVLQELEGLAPQVVFTVPLLPGLDGVQRMSKSLGNYIGVTDPPHEMYGKVMSLPDDVMASYWRLVTDASAADREAAIRDLSDPAVNPMTVKKRLARRLAAMYHGSEAAAAAERDFEAQFSRREPPASLASWDPGAGGEMGIKDLLVRSGLAASGSAAWRAVDQGAVSIDGARVVDRNHRQPLEAPFVLRLGRRMIRVERGAG